MTIAAATIKRKGKRGRIQREESGGRGEEEKEGKAGAVTCYAL